MKRFILLIVVGLAAVALAQHPRVSGQAVVLGHVDAGTLPTPVLGGMVYDTLTGLPLQSDGGGWASLGGGGSGSARSYLFATLTTNQTANITADDHVKFDSVLQSAGSDITLDTTTAYAKGNNVASVGRFTLAASKTYRLTANINAENGNQLQIGWATSADGAPIQNGVFAFTYNYSATNHGGSHTIDAMITVGGSAVLVDLRLFAVTSLAAIGQTSTSADAGTVAYRPTAMIEVY